MQPLKRQKKFMVKDYLGTIINVSSIAGFKPFGNHAAYCASKFGVHALSETIKQEIVLVIR